VAAATEAATKKAVEVATREAGVEAKDVAGETVKKLFQKSSKDEPEGELLTEINKLIAQAVANESRSFSDRFFDRSIASIGIFAGLISFVSAEVQIFSRVCDLGAAVAFSVLLAATLVLVIYVAGVLLTQRQNENLGRLTLQGLGGLFVVLLIGWAMSAAGIFKFQGDDCRNENSENRPIAPAIILRNNQQGLMMPIDSRPAVPGDDYLKKRVE
jgi:drug/metabolite transporter superfamily protein YnfA